MVLPYYREYMTIVLGLQLARRLAFNTSITYNKAFLDYEEFMNHSSRLKPGNGLMGASILACD